MSTDVIKKLQDKATVLTQERKMKGRTLPEELTTQEDLRSFRTLASHPVSYIFLKSIANMFNYIIVKRGICEIALF